jgi:regulatory protein
MAQRFPRQPKLLDAAALEAYAVRILRGRGMSIGELREKLKRKAENAAEIDPILSKLKQYGFLDDRKFADAMSASRKENHGLGKARVLRELRQRRVAPVVAQESVEAAYEGVDEVGMIEAFLARKFRNIDLAKHLADEKNLASAFRKLRYSGFSAGNSIRVLKRFAERAGELEDDESEPEA